MHVWSDGIFNGNSVATLLPSLAVKRVLKIGQHLAKLMARLQWHISDTVIIDSAGFNVPLNTLYVISGTGYGVK